MRIFFIAGKIDNAKEGGKFEGRYLGPDERSGSALCFDVGLRLTEPSKMGS